SGAIVLNHNSSGTNNTYRLFAAEDNTLSLSGSMSDSNTSLGSTHVEIAGPGVVRFVGTAANTSVTPVAIAEGATLVLAKSASVNAIAGGSISVAGTLRLGASEQIGNGTALSFTGGVFEV